MSRFPLIAVIVLLGAALAALPRTTHRLPPPPSPAHAGVTVPAAGDEDLRLRRAYDLRRLADPRTGALPPDILRREQAFAATLPRRSPADKTITWTFRGPDNVGGRTRALAFDVGVPGGTTILAGGVSGGLWRSVDDGATWTLTTGSSRIHSVSCLAQDTRTGHRNVWYYGTGEGDGGSASWPQAFSAHAGDGVFKSTDGGVTWAPLAATAGADPQSFSSPWQFVWRLAVDPTNAVQDEVYAATWGAVFRSVDGGQTWTPVLGGGATPATYTDVAVTSTGVVYATLSYDGTVHGAFRSPDGVTWTDITPPGAADYDRIVIAPAPSNPDVVWFISANTYGLPDAVLLRYQYLSGDGSGAGGSFADRSALLGSLPGPFGSTNYETQESYCQMLTVDPADPETLYLGGVFLWRSTDGFQTPGNISFIGGWDYPDHHADLHWLTYRPGSTTQAWTGSDGGVHATADVTAPVVSWTSRNVGYNTTQFYTLAIDEELSGSPVAIGGTQDNGTLFGGTDTPTAVWVQPLAADGGWCAVADASGAWGTYYASYQQDYGIYRLLLDNVNGTLGAWTVVDPQGAGTSLWLRPYVLDPNDRNVMYLAADDVVWRNGDLAGIPDYNASPTLVNWDVLTSDPLGSPVTAFAVSRSAARTLWFGTADGALYRLDGAVSVPSGTAAVRLDVGAGFPAGAWVSSIAVDPDDDQRALVAFSNYNVVNLHYTADGGATWKAVEGNLGGPDSPSVRSVAFLPLAGGELVLAATSTGLYSTADLNAPTTVWQQEAATVLGNVVVDMVKVRRADRLVVAATHGRGVVQGRLTATPVPDGGPAAVLALEPNVPNPFNPSTTIAFTLDRAGPVRIEVFDLGGRRLRVLSDGPRAAGRHTVRWRGDDDRGRPAASGTYVCRLTAGSDVRTRSMTLLR